MLSPIETNLIYRVLDANLNRAVEGLRAVEEYFRFIAENRRLTEQIKQLRHQVSSRCQNWIEIWSDQRDSSSDVGADVVASDEYRRSSAADIVGANLARVNQALRAIEEYSKAVCPELPSAIESIRYEFYDLEKEVKRFLFSGNLLRTDQLYVLTSGCETLDLFEQRVRLLCESGVDLIQLREKNIDDADILARAKLGVQICADFPSRFIVNDRPDIAVISNADGVHIGQEELPVTDVKRIVPHSMLIGVSTHSIEQAWDAEKAGADYIGVGPTFPSHTKCFNEFPGIELVKKVADEINIPAFAIGGINLDNLNQVIDAGFSRVAVSGVIHQADSPFEVIQQIKRRLQNQS